jgi:hypothetical protein
MSRSQKPRARCGDVLSFVAGSKKAGWDGLALQLNGTDAYMATAKNAISVGLIGEQDRASVNQAIVRK